MATKVYMEALSPTMEEGQVVKWHRKEGDPVAQGDVLADIETDKATMELAARGQGVLRRIIKEEGESVPVGELIAVIASEDEDIGGIVDIPGDGGPGTRAAPVPPAPEDRAEGEAEAPSDRPKLKSDKEVEGIPEPAPGERIRASPLARRLAVEAGIELSRVRGSGPGGRIIKRDVEEAAERPVPSAREGGVTPEPEFEVLRPSQMRKTIAKRLAQSLGPVPHFYLTVDVDMDRAVQARARMNDLLGEQGEKVSLNDLIVRAAASALGQHPAVNASWRGDHVRRYRSVHIGVAVAVEDGLITPVIRDANRKGVAEIAREIRELAGRARERKLSPEEYQGATFSISNLGMFGIHEFTAVINPPEGAILAVGQVAEMPVALEGQVVIRPRMRVTMSCDHRVVDGATGARFLQTLKAMLEEPAAILL